MNNVKRPVQPFDAFFFLRPTPVEAQAYRIASLSLLNHFGGTVGEQFYLTVQRASDIAPDDWMFVLSDLHRTLSNTRPFKLKATGLWRFYSEFRQSKSLFWTTEITPPLSSLRQNVDQVLQKYGAVTYPFPISEWKPHTPALHNVLGQEGDLALPPGVSPPAFTVKELWLSIYQPWGSFVEHPLVIFSGNQ